MPTARNPCSERASWSYTDLPLKHPRSRIRVANGRAALQGPNFSSPMLLAKGPSTPRMRRTLGSAGHTLASRNGMLQAWP